MKDKNKTVKTNQENKFYWGYDHKKQERTFVTGEEFLRRLEPLISEPVESLRELDGDMMMSDYQHLCNAKHRIETAIEYLDKDKDKGE